MDLSSLFYIGSFFKNIGLILFLGSTLFVIYLAFRDTMKRGFYCFILPYHLYYAMERLRHPWKKQIIRVLFSGLWLTLLGVVLSHEAISYVSLGSSVFNGLAQGSYYALMAFAIILIFKTTDLVNFAQADMATVTTFFMLALAGKFSESGEAALVPYGMAILLMILFSGVFGAATEMVFVKPIQKQHPISQIILTLGLSIMFSSLIGIILKIATGKMEEVTVPTMLGREVPNVSIGGDILIAKDAILSIVVTFAIMAIIFILFKYTLLGISLRATAQSQTTSRLMGINTNRVFIFSWAVSVILGALAALFAFSGKTIGTYTISSLLLKGFAAAVLGGFSSLPGAVLGGLMLGVFDNILGLITNMKDALSFLIILLVLIIKPDGILGKKTIKKV